MAVGLAELRLAMLLPVFLVPCREEQSHSYFIDPQGDSAPFLCAVHLYFMQAFNN